MTDRLVLAEDEILVRGVLSRFLSRRGFEVMEAEHGEAALRLLSNLRTEVDAVVTDLDMPRIDGYEVIRVLRGYRPELPIIAMSNTAWRADLESGPTDLAPGVPLLPKPLDLALLVRTIDDCIADARERREEARIARERAARARESAGVTRARSIALKARHVDLVALAMHLRSHPVP
jgi:CheY-like chemotaxis protein